MPLNLNTPLPKASQTKCCYSLYECSISHFAVLIFCTSVEVCVHVGMVCTHDSYIVQAIMIYGWGHVCVCAKGGLIVFALLG